MIETSQIRLLKSDVKVWLINAGKNRRFLDEFVSKRRIFLNLPGFGATSAAFQDEELLRRHLDRSWAINEFIRGSRSTAPSLNLTNYTSYPFASGTSDARAFSEAVGNVIRLFVKAQVGDLVLVPRLGPFSPFLIGEITAKWSANDDLQLNRFDGYAVPSRSVRWLQTAVTRSDFPPRIGRRLVNRHAVTEVTEDFYEEIFNRVYPNYSWGNISKLDIFGNGYTGKDPTQPFVAAQLIKYVLASVFAYEKGEIDKFNQLSKQSIDVAISAYYDVGLVDELTQNFNSPGRFTFIGRLGILSALTAAGIALATAEGVGSYNDQKTAVEQQIGDELVGSKASRTDAQAEIENFLKAADPQVWKPVQQKLGTPAREQLGLSLDNKVELERKISELEQ